MTQPNNTPDIDLNVLYDTAKKASKVSYYTDPELFQAFKNLVLNCQHNLSAEYMPYDLYQEKEQIYVLIHTDYLESDEILFNDMDLLIKKDGAYLHNELKKSGLAINYLFILPYYNYIDKKIGSFLFEAVITNELLEIE